MRKIDIFNHIIPLEIFDQIQVWVPGHPIANLFKGIPLPLCEYRAKRI
jgi:hypothetical protein